MRQKINRPWKDYPIGTEAHSFLGGHWTKTEHGWKWDGGDTFPTPSIDAAWVVLP